MVSVVIIGSGNVACHLTNAFLKTAKVEVKQMFSRKIYKLHPFSNKIPLTDNIENLKKADVYIVCVSDDAISKVSASIFDRKSLVVHTSGSMPMDILKNSGRKGVLYPLQTFSKEKDISFKQIPMCIEAEKEEDYKVLEQIASSISNKIYHISSSQRSKLHVAAVFVNNFTNHMFKIGNDICEKYKLPFDILYPLIEETVSKIQEISPKEAQTGPAKRDDKSTFKNHLKLLDEDQKELYIAITNSIKKTYNKL